MTTIETLSELPVYEQDHESRLHQVAEFLKRIVSFNPLEAPAYMSEHAHYHEQ